MKLAIILALVAIVSSVYSAEEKLKEKFEPKQDADVETAAFEAVEVKKLEKRSPDEEWRSAPPSPWRSDEWRSAPPSPWRSDEWRSAPPSPWRSDEWRSAPPSPWRSDEWRSAPPAPWRSDEWRSAPPSPWRSGGGSDRNVENFIEAISIDSNFPNKDVCSLCAGNCDKTICCDKRYPRCCEPETPRTRNQARRYCACCDP